MTLEDRIKQHLSQLAPHVAHRESATLLTLCLGELKLAKEDARIVAAKNLGMAFTIERLESAIIELKADIQERIDYCESEDE